jgi:hypothetical protein
MKGRLTAPSQVMLSLNEAAARLGVSRAALEAMIAEGQVEALRGEFLCIMPKREVKRLLRGTSGSGVAAIAGSGGFPAASKPAIPGTGGQNSA